MPCRAVFLNGGPYTANRRRAQHLTACDALSLGLMGNAVRMAEVRFGLNRMKQASADRSHLTDHVGAKLSAAPA